MKAIWKILFAVLLVAGGAVLLVYKSSPSYYLDDAASKTITIGDARILVSRKDELTGGGVSRVTFTNLSSAPIDLRVAHHMIFNASGSDPINWLLSMKRHEGSGYLSVDKPFKDCVLLSYGADFFKLNEKQEHTLEIPRQRLLYIAPADEKVFPDADDGPVENSR